MTNIESKPEVDKSPIIAAARKRVSASGRPSRRGSLKMRSSNLFPKINFFKKDPF